MRVPFQEQIYESNSHHAGEEPPSSVRKNIAALLNHATSSAFGTGLGLAVVGVHGQGEIKAPSGNFPTPEACEHKLTHLPGQSYMPQSIGCALISSLLLFVQQFSFTAFILCLFKLVL